MLVSYRFDPNVATRFLPRSVGPQLVRGWAVAGICLIRLGRLRPHGLPSAVGLRRETPTTASPSSGARPDGPATGVYIARRDTATRLNAAAGGRLFPREHRLARFRANEAAGRVRVAFDSNDGTTAVDVTVDAAPRLTPSALFADLAEVSSFFEDSSLG